MPIEAHVQLDYRLLYGAGVGTQASQRIPYDGALFGGCLADQVPTITTSRPLT